MESTLRKFLTNLWFDIKFFLANNKAEKLEERNLIALAKAKKPIREVGHTEHLSVDPHDPGAWREDEISDCEYGCKIYVNTKTLERVLGHSSAYGCRK